MKTQLFYAKLVATLPGVALGGNNAVPNEIQWMPPGTHNINAMQGDKPVSKQINVTATAAKMLDAQLQDLRAKAAAGTEDLPYFDFNHNDDGASGYPLQFFWGGDDPVKGGIRAKVEWSGSGEEALQNRVYRRFSPSFLVNAAGEVTGAPVNMGGLVNRAAFKKINPIVASAADDGKNKSMANENTAADLATANAEIARLTKLVTEAQSTQAIQAKDAEITNLKAEITKLKGELAVQAKSSAKAIVDAAVKAGKLAPQNTALHAKWVDTIAANPELAETLNAMEANPALATVVLDPNKPGTGAGATAEHEFIVKAKQVAKDRFNNDVIQAQSALATEQPALYAAYRASLQGK